MKKWYEIKNEANEAEIMIFDEIGLWGVDASMFKRDFDKVKSSSKIKVLLNSPGGSVFDGVAIYNILKDVKDKLEIEVVGLAASIASIIAMAGNKITMREGTFLMIHKPWTMTMGDANELEKTAKLLDQIEDQMVGIYKAKTGIEEDEIKTMLTEETWMSPKDALEKGFIDEIDEEAPKMAAKFNRDFKALGFNKTPEEISEETVKIKFDYSELTEILNKFKDGITKELQTSKDEQSSDGDIHDIEEKGDESLRDTEMYQKRLKILQHTIN